MGVDEIRDMGFIIDLQLFAGEKTEPATQRKREEARRKGQVFRSPEVGSAGLLLLGVLTLRYSAPASYQRLHYYTIEMLSAAGRAELSVEGLPRLMMDATFQAALAVTPLMVAVALTGIALNVLQVGFIFNSEPLAPQLSRINPISGFQRILSKRALVEMVKSIAKFIAVSYLVYSSVMAVISDIPGLLKAEVASAAVMVLLVAASLAMKVGAFLAVLAALDYLYQKWEYDQSLRMTKQEVKDEFKDVEGDPQIQARIRRRQREMAFNRMMVEVTTADAIITNPIHYAVALRYDAKAMFAPRVVAKGQRLVAERIKEIARANGVPVVEKPALARALFQATEVGDYVPEELYKAVAEVLAFVYRLRGRASVGS